MVLASFTVMTIVRASLAATKNGSRSKSSSPHCVGNPRQMSASPEKTYHVSTTKKGVPGLLVCDVVGADKHHFALHVMNGSNLSRYLPGATVILPVKSPVDVPEKLPVEEEDLRPVIKNLDRPANQDFDIKEKDLRPVIGNPERPANHDSDF